MNVCWTDLNVLNLQVVALFFFKIQYISSILKTLWDRELPIIAEFWQMIMPNTRSNLPFPKLIYFLPFFQGCFIRCTFAQFKRNLAAYIINFMGSLQLRAGNPNHLNYLNVCKSKLIESNSRVIQPPSVWIE